MLLPAGSVGNALPNRRSGKRAMLQRRGQARIPPVHLWRRGPEWTKENNRPRIVFLPTRFPWNRMSHACKPRSGAAAARVSVVVRWQGTDRRHLARRPMLLPRRTHRCSLPHVGGAAVANRVRRPRPRFSLDLLLRAGLGRRTLRTTDGGVAQHHRHGCASTSLAALASLSVTAIGCYGDCDASWAPAPSARSFA
jgi:hypothetical protein